MQPKTSKTAPARGRRKLSRHAALTNAVFFVAATGLAFGPDAWLEWLFWGWTAGLVVAVRLTLMAIAALTLGVIIWSMLHHRSS